MPYRDVARRFLAVAAVALLIGAGDAPRRKLLAYEPPAGCQQAKSHEERGATEAVSEEASPEGYLSLSRQALIDQLELNQKQAADIGREIRKYQTELRKLYGNWPPGAQDREGENIRRSLIAQHAAHREEAIRNIAGFLSDAQRKKLATLKRLYSDQESPARNLDDKSTPITLKKSPYASLETESQGLRYVMQNYRDGTMANVRVKNMPHDGPKIDVDVNSTGVLITIDDRRQKRPFWHSEDRVITAVALSPNGKRVATGTGWFPNQSNLKTPGEVRLWDVATGALLQKEFFSQDVYALGFSDDDTLLVGLEPRGGR